MGCYVMAVLADASTGKLASHKTLATQRNIGKTLKVTNGERHVRDDLHSDTRGMKGNHNFAVTASKEVLNELLSVTPSLT